MERIKGRIRNLEPGFKLRFNFLDLGGLGPTGYKILEQILEGKSISEAAKRLDLSYRFVRGYINKLERRCGLDVVSKRRGASGGTKIRPCGSAIYALYRQLYRVLSRLVSIYKDVMTEAPLRNALHVKHGYVFGLLDVLGVPGGKIVIPPHANSLGERLEFRVKPVASREAGRRNITTVAVYERADLPEGKILVDPFGICTSRAAPRSPRRAEGR